VFGGIAGGRRSTCKALASDKDVLPTSSAWLYLPEDRTWLSVDVSQSGLRPRARLCHACVASAYRLMSMVCYGGLSTAGQVLADTWMLTIDGVDKAKKRVNGTWKRIDTGHHLIGGRHSFSMMSSTQPAAAGAVTGAQEGFLVVGGSASDAKGNLNVPLSDLWMLVVSHDPTCSDTPAAWHRLFPMSQTGKLPNIDVSAVLTGAGDLLAFGSEPTEQSPPVVPQPSLRLSSAAVHILKGAGCLHPSTALSQGCAGTTTPLHACHAAAHMANLTLVWDMGNLELLKHLEALAVIDILDSNGQPLIPSQDNPFYHESRLQAAGTGQSKVTALDRSLSSEHVTSAGWQSEALVVNVAFTPGTRVQAILSVLGMQVAATGLLLLANKAAHRLELKSFPRRPLALSSPDGIAHKHTQLSVSYGGKRAAWSDISRDAGQVKDSAFQLQVTPIFPMPICRTP
jgi:hypothetical protein